MKGRTKRQQKKNKKKIKNSLHKTSKKTNTQRQQMKIYTILDAKAEHYHLPFYAHNDAVAIRICENGVRDPETELAKHPADFILFRVGEFDESTGILTTSLNIAICNLIDLSKEN